MSLTRAALAAAVVAATAVAAPSAGAQTGNPVQDAINRDMMNRAILNQATHGKPLKTPPPKSTPLYGRWLPMPETNQLKTVGTGCTSLELIYTPTTHTYVTPTIGPYPSERKTQKVTYVKRDARSFYVVPETATVGMYVEIIDEDHIRPEAADQCIYKRAG